MEGMSENLFTELSTESGDRDFSCHILQSTISLTLMACATRLIKLEDAIPLSALLSVNEGPQSDANTLVCLTEFRTRPIVVLWEEFTPRGNMVHQGIER